MIRYIEMLNALRDANGTNEKKRTLEKYPDQKEQLKYALDPYMRFHLTSKSVILSVGTKTVTWSEVKNVLDKLHTRQVTGNTAVGMVNTLLYKATTESYGMFYTFIDKDLRVGLGTSMVNKVFPKMIPTFDLQLCEKYEDLNKVPFEGTYCSRKLDGIRVIAMFKEERWRFYSRKGIEFTVLDVLSEDLMRSNISREIVLDGEVCLKTVDGNDDFNGIVSEIRKKNHTIKNPFYHIFDMVLEEEFVAGKSDVPFKDKIGLMNFVIGPGRDHYKVLPQWKVLGVEHLEHLVNQVETYGWEGLILRNGDVGYEGKRTKNLLKVKKFQDAEFTITGVFEGEGDLEGSLGGFFIEGEVDFKKKIVMCRSKVGTGFTHETRKKVWLDPLSYVGRQVTIKFFEVSQNKENKLFSLRFPVLKKIWEQKRDV